MPKVDLSLLTKSVANCTDVVSSAYMLVYGICTELESVRQDEAATYALLLALRTDIAALAMAVADNTDPTPVDRSAVTKPDVGKPSVRPPRASPDVTSTIPVPRESRPSSRPKR